VWNILTAIFESCTEYGVPKSPNILLLHTQSMVLCLYKIVEEIRPLRHSSRFPATTLTTSLTRETFSSFHAQSSFCILILSTPWHTCIIMSLRGTRNITTHASYIRPHPGDGLLSFFFLTVAVDCLYTHASIDKETDKTSLKKRKGRGKICEKRMCFQVIQPKNVFGFGTTLLDIGVLLEYANV